MCRHYKKIDISEMEKTDDCLEQEKEEQQERKDEAARLREEAEEKLVKARNLEKQEE